MKILIVEDNEINARMLDLMMNELVFEASHTIANDAKSALSLCEDHQFDLILMDINLGDGLMDGTEVMKVLKSKESYKKVPMYAITCYSMPGDRERFLSDGFDKYFSKPVRKEELLTAITEDKSVES